MRNLVFMFMAFAFGCGNLSSQKTVDHARGVIDAATVICESVELFDQIGTDIPGVEQCKKVVPYLTSEELESAANVAECLTDPDKTKREKYECMAEEDALRLARKFIKFVKEK